MKKYFSLLLCFALASAAFAQSKSEKEPYLTRSLSGESIKNVEASTSGGSISVAGVTASEARIEVFVFPNNSNTSLSKEELKKRLEELYNLDVKVAGNKLTAIAKSKEPINDWTKALNIAFKIYVPQNVSTDLATSGGSISLSNLTGNQDFSTSGGSLNLEKLSGKIHGRTSGGSINLENSKDEIDLETSGGSINASNCSGNLKLETSGGSLHLDDLNGTIRAKTSGGSVKGKNIGGELITHTSGGSIDLRDLACSLETSTSGGNIAVSINQLGKYVRISNSAGNINITLPKNKGLNLDFSGRMSNTHLENFDGKIDEDSVKGKLNGGGVPVTIDANSGRIRIELK
jgi:hypothetical protein